MFESEVPDSSVLRKSMSEEDEWEKEEVEEVVLTSSTDREPAVHVTLNSLSFQEFGLGELGYIDEHDEYIQENNREVDKRAELQQMLENHLNQVEDTSQWWVVSDLALWLCSRLG